MMIDMRVYMYNDCPFDHICVRRAPCAATCIEVVVAIVGFNVFFRIAVTTLDPTCVSPPPQEFVAPNCHALTCL